MEVDSRLLDGKRLDVEEQRAVGSADRLDTTTGVEVEVVAVTVGWEREGEGVPEDEPGVRSRDAKRY